MVGHIPPLAERVKRDRVSFPVNREMYNNGLTEGELATETDDA